jgi:hypothetical protein
MSGQLPPFVQEMLRTFPRAGQGVHDRLFKVARQLHWHMGIEEMADLLEEATANCGRFVPRREIMDAIRNSLPCAWQPGGVIGQPVYAARKWPEVNQEKREAIIASGFRLVDLREASPVRFDDSDAHTEEIIDALFPNDPLLCCGKSNSEFDTKPREEWRGQLSRLQFITPSPMATRTGRTQEGKESAHTLDNTGPRQNLAVEFDHGTVDDHAAVLLHLAEDAPLVLVVHSGSKSLHGWFPCHEQTEEQLYQFMLRAVSLGACNSTWCRSQFVRMPDGLRDNGNRQVVYYFDPEVIR